MALMTFDSAHPYTNEANRHGRRMAAGNLAHRRQGVRARWPVPAASAREAQPQRCGQLKLIHLSHQIVRAATRSPSTLQPPHPTASHLAQRTSSLAQPNSPCPASPHLTLRAPCTTLQPTPQMRLSTQHPVALRYQRCQSSRVSVFAASPSDRLSYFWVQLVRE